MASHYQSKQQVLTVSAGASLLLRLGLANVLDDFTFCQS